MKKTTTPELDAINMKSSHTPTPKRARIETDEDYGNQSYFVYANEQSGDLQIEVRSGELNSWREIVKCVNAHEGLVQAAQMARYYVEKLWNETKGSDREGTAMGCAGALDALDKVLAQAEGK